MASVGVAPLPGSARAWWLAARPRTLSVSLAAVAVGTAAAAAEGEAAAAPALAALCGALLLQVGANWVNDYADFERGADGRKRLGPPRAAQQGWLSVSQLRTGARAAFALAALIGVYLVWRGGAPIALMGALAIAAAWGYTSGPALGYRGLGDVLVFAFFGLFAVVGTTVVQAGRPSALSLVVAIPVGLLATLLLAVNNLRDLEGDALAGKRTSAVRLGEPAARRYAQGLLLGSYASLPAIGLVARSAWPVLLPLLALPLARPLLAALARDRGAPLNAALARSSKLSLVFALLLAAGLLL